MLGFSLPKDTQRLSREVLALSDHFQKSSRQTPWTSNASRAAYLAYFMPYNFYRLERVFRLLPLSFWSQVSSVVEVGSGAGNGQAALSMVDGLQLSQYFVVEKSPEAFALHQNLSQVLHLSSPQKSLGPFPKGTLALFSYSLNEIGDLPPWCSTVDHLCLIEPSTEVFSRQLMALRGSLLEKNWTVLAPCTHQQACPLLTQSKRDFCHDRFAPSRPEWLLELESFLPMKNQTLTLSYLVLSRHSERVFAQGRARVIGDTLFEKGKVRQALCRGPEREFLSVLTKHDKTFRGFEHGSLIELPEEIEKKGNELRLKMSDSRR